MVMRSGRRPHCSLANRVPVRPKPVATSSQISRTSWRRQASTSGPYAAGSATSMPAAPWTRGSTTTAARRRPWSSTRAAALRQRVGVVVAGGPDDGAAAARPERPRSAAGRTGRCRTRRRRATASRRCRRGRRARGQVAGASGHAEVGPVLEGDLERLLDRRRAVGGEQEVRVVDRHHLGQRLGQLDHDAVAVAEQGGVGDPVDLGAEGGVELGHPVAERRDPQGRDGVEVAPALDVDQLAALGRLHDDGLVVEVARHLGEAVPHDGGIPLTPGPGVDHDPPA